MLSSILHYTGCLLFTSFRSLGVRSRCRSKKRRATWPRVFHQCERVADWLCFKSSYMRLAYWLRVESSDPKNRDSRWNTNAAYAISPAAKRNSKQTNVNFRRLARRSPSTVTQFGCFENTSSQLAQWPTSAKARFGCFETTLGLPFFWCWKLGNLALTRSNLNASITRSDQEHSRQRIRTQTSQAVVNRST